MGSNPILDITFNSNSIDSSPSHICDNSSQLNSNTKQDKNDLILLKSIYFKNKENFKLWLENKYSRNYIVNVITGVEKIFFHEVKSIYDVKNLFIKKKIPLKTCSVGFRVLLNYFEEYDLFDDNLIDLYRRKIKIIKNKPNLNIFVPNHSEIKKSIQILSQTENKDYLIYYLLMLESGIRVTELVHFLLNFNEKNLEINENGICLYKNFYLRGQKSSFYIFFTIKTYENLKPYLKKQNEIRIRNFCKYIFRQKEVSNLKTLRKYQFNLLIEKEVSFEIANFIQGRASQNIGFNHYLAKKKIAEKEYVKIIPEFKKF